MIELSTRILLALSPVFFERLIAIIRHFLLSPCSTNQSLYTHRFGRGSDWKFQASALHVTKVSETHPVGKIHVNWSQLMGFGNLCNRLLNFIGEDCSFPPRVRHTLFWLLATVERVYYLVASKKGKWRIQRHLGQPTPWVITGSTSNRVLLRLTYNNKKPCDLFGDLIHFIAVEFHLYSKP